MADPELSITFGVRFPDFHPDDLSRLDELSHLVGFRNELGEWLEDFTRRVARMALTSEIDPPDGG